MTSTPHNELIEKLDAIRLLSPDVRFGQLLANLSFLVEDQTDQPLRDIEDQRLLEVMEKHRGDLAYRPPDGLPLVGSGRLSSVP